MILADIVYWHRPTIVRDEKTGQQVGVYKKFKRDKLQRSRRYYVSLFGYSMNQVSEALKFLVEQGVITTELRQDIKTKAGAKLGNVMFIDLNVPRLKQITYTEKTDTLPQKNRHPTQKNRDTNTETTPEITTEITTLFPAPADTNTFPPESSGTVPVPANDPSHSEKSSPPISPGSGAAAGDIKGSLSESPDGAKRSTGVGTLNTGPPPDPQTSSPDPPLKRPKGYKRIQARLEGHFEYLTKVPRPARRTKAQRTRAQVRWWSPLGEIGDMCEWDEARAKDELTSAFKKAQAEGWDQSVTAPQSLLETVRGIIGARTRAKAMAEPVPFGPPGDYVAPGRNGTNRKGSGEIDLTEAQKAVKLW
jgi:hypothetical protein